MSGRSRVTELFWRAIAPAVDGRSAPSALMLVRGTTMDTALVVRALRMALMRRRIVPGLIHHSDRGSQYASDAYQRLLRQHGCQVSMSRRGDCWDNAPVESFFSTLKTELARPPAWPTRRDAACAIADYIECFYNPHRLHSALNYRSPMAFEATMRVVG